MRLLLGDSSWQLQAAAVVAAACLLGKQQQQHGCSCISSQAGLCGCISCVLLWNRPGLLVAGV